MRLPAIVDHHVHLGLVDRQALGRSGLGAVIDLGWVPGEAAAWRPGLGSTAVRIAGPFHTARGGYPSGRAWAPDAAVRELTSVADARAAVREAAGADLLKVALHSAMPLLDDEVLAAFVAAGHAAGLPVVVHAEGPGQAARALAAGADALAHAPWTERLDDGTVGAMAAAMVWISTLALHHGDAARVAVDNATRFVAAGGRLAYGTDLGNGPGPAGVRRDEVVALGRCGLTGDALLAALTEPAFPGWELPRRTVEGPGPVPRDAAGLADWYALAVPADDPSDRAAAEDAVDPLRSVLARFADAGDVVAYLDGNSLGRPLAEVPDRLAEFTRQRWGGRLIRGWDEGWMAEPERLGDELARHVLGAAPGTTVVGDSTSVLLYKAVRAAVAARPGRSEIVFAAADFPTDRFLLQGIADELDLRLVPVAAPHDGAVGVEAVGAAVGQETAAVVLSHVAYRSAGIVDLAAVTALAHAAGALTVWDLSHSAGVLPLALDDWAIDLAVGCGYKYLNGGPGAPAFLYASGGLAGELRQPLQGWMGAADVFAMGERYEPADGIRRFLTGTPPILAMLPLASAVELIAEVGMPAIRAKSVALTGFAVDWIDEHLAPFGARLASPRDPALRGGHVTVDHPAFRAMLPRLHTRGVIPDFRGPDGLRLGLSPLSTSFAELLRGLEAVEEELAAAS